jgi:Response regulator containing CheY-like receiver, AAA-type ATPase, and DNA-binding domains
LRERRENIPLLSWTFVKKFGNSMGKRIEEIAEESMSALQNYHWPGNIRQLRNVIERATILCQGPKLYIKLSRTALRPIAVIADHPPAFDIARGCKVDSASAFDLLRHNGWGS